MAARCTQLARERAHPEQTDRKIVEVWEEERAALRARPAPFDGFAESSARISTTCLVNFERNRYSVECRYVGRVATIRAYAERIVLICAEQMIGEHPRCFSRGRTLYNPWHYVPALERKPGALRNGGALQRLKFTRRHDAFTRAIGQTRRRQSPVRGNPLNGLALRPRCPYH